MESEGWEKAQKNDIRSLDQAILELLETRIAKAVRLRAERPGASSFTDADKAALIGTERRYVTDDLIEIAWAAVEVGVLERIVKSEEG